MGINRQPSYGHKNDCFIVIIRNHHPFLVDIFGPNEYSELGGHSKMLMCCSGA